MHDLIRTICVSALQHLCIQSAEACSLLQTACLALGTEAKMVSRRLLDDSCSNTVPTWAQCGGRTCPDGSGTHCSDKAYNCCSSGNSCERQNQWYWQCLPPNAIPGTHSAAASGTFVSTRKYSTAFCCKAPQTVHLLYSTLRGAFN